MDRRLVGTTPADGRRGKAVALAVFLAVLGCEDYPGGLFGTWPAHDLVFEDVGLAAARYGDVAWGDFDSDGDLDLVLAGDSGGTYVTKVYRSEDGSFVEHADLAGVTRCAVAWGDFDSDGDLDLAVGGVAQAGARTCTIYRNEGGSFVDTGAILTGVEECALCWVDFDSDGDLDLAVGGYTGTGFVGSVYENDAGAFGAVGASFTGVRACSVVWADYDSDGDLDVALAGDSNSGNVCEVWKNDGLGGLAVFAASFEPVFYCALAWGDVNSDGRPDLLVAGARSGDPGDVVARVYQYNGVSFSDTGAPLAQVGWCAGAWGDYDANGYLDLALLGSAGNLEARVYRNRDGWLTDSTVWLDSFSEPSVAWGDYDSDGDLDLAVTGERWDWGASGAASGVFLNVTDRYNNPPSAPANLSEAVSGAGPHEVTFSWDAASDAETPVWDPSPPYGLTYNLRVGTQPGEDSIMPAMSIIDTGNALDGKRCVPAAGNAWHNFSWKVKELPAGTYYWSVQAVDAGFAGSVWAPERSFEITKIWYVDGSAAPGGDGLAWATAFRNPQDAVDAASAGDDVWVADGTYTNAYAGGGTATVLAMKDGVAIYGGFVGNETDFGARNPAGNPTVLDGEDTAYHVVVGASNATLDGFTVTRGNANGAFPDDRGAGMYNDAVSSLAVSDCVFSSNTTTTDDGAGIYSAGSSLNVLRCRFVSNTANSNGGGMVNTTSTAVVADCIFDGNAAGAGGGIFNYQASATISNCTFSQNTEGAMSGRGGGAICNATCDAQITNCTFVGNQAPNDDGGAIYDYATSSPSIANCVFWGNSALTATIFNEADSSCTVTYSNVQGGYPGTGNIDAAPTFADPADPDGPDDVFGTGDDGLALNPGSPCIDSADGDAAPEFDILGQPRHDDIGTPDTGVGAITYADMGAYEFQGTTLFKDSGTIPVDVLGSVAWVDCDNDGDLDIALSGLDGGGSPVAQIFENTGGVFSGTPAGLPQVRVLIACGDVDADGDVDLALSGGDPASTSEVYLNDGGVFSDAGAVLAEGGLFPPAWGDYDNDGDIDLLMAGKLISELLVTRLYRNSGGALSEAAVPLQAVWRGSAAWGDFDNDGDLDLALTGSADALGGTAVSKVYRNDDGTFTEVAAGLLALRTGSSVAWGDYDCDGDLDLVICGQDDAVTFHSKVYRNDGSGQFVDVDAGLQGVQWAWATWGDCDNDGDLDLAIMGLSAAGYVSLVYRNDGSDRFVDIGPQLTGGFIGRLAWGDYDNDGDLDLAIAAKDDWVGNPFTTIYRNDCPVANTRPAAPAGLSATASGSDVVFTWDAGADDETPSPGLTYNLRVGTQPGADDVMPAHAVIGGATDGHRLIPAMGNVQHNLSWTVKGLAQGTYYWSVQAVDTGFAGSPWTPEESVNVRLAWYVDGDVAASGDGTSWAQAFKTIQEGNAAAAAGEEVWVAEGTYTNAVGGDTSTVLVMKDGVGYYGGFGGLGGGDETLRSERDPKLHETILDGLDTAFHVVEGASNATLDGFTVTRGNADGLDPQDDGAGLSNAAVSNLQVSHCTFMNNTASDRGGGIYNNQCSPTVIACVFANNVAWVGAGMFNHDGSAPTVEGCTFSLNAAGLAGGAIHNHLLGSSPPIVGCSFSGNTAGTNGTCIYAKEGAPTIVNSILWNGGTNEITLEFGATCVVTYSSLQGCGGSGGGWDVSFGTDAGGNIDLDPLFVDAADPDGPDDIFGTSDDGLRLQPGSPCIDAADGDQAPEFDLLGNPRHDDVGTPDTGVGVVTYADMGAYEFQGDSSLVGHWKFDETSGTTAADSSGNGNDGTLVNMAGTEWTTGKIGGALAFTKDVRDYVETLNTDNLDSPVTFSFWVKFSTIGIAEGVMSGFSGPNAWSVMLLQWSATDNLWWVENAIPGGTSTTTIFQADAWYHLAIVHNLGSGTVDIYTDGTLDGTGSATFSLQTGVQLQIGDGPASSAFHGILDDVRIYDRVLTATEIQALHQAGQ